jgi:hypothetical protein
MFDTQALTMKVVNSQCRQLILFLEYFNYYNSFDTLFRVDVFFSICGDFFKVKEIKLRSRKDIIHHNKFSDNFNFGQGDKSF